VGRSGRPLACVRSLALLLAALCAAEPAAWADGLLYKPGDIILPFVDNAAVGEVVAFDPVSLESTPIATGNLLNPDPLGVALDANGDVLVIVYDDSGPTSADVIRVDGHTGAQSLVVDMPMGPPPDSGGLLDGTPNNPARVGNTLYVRTDATVVAVDLDHESAAVIARGGFLVESPRLFVTAETDSTLLTFGGPLVRLSLDSLQQSIAANPGAGEIFDVVVLGSVPILLTNAGLLELDPVLGPTLLFPFYEIPGETTVGMLPSGDFVVGNVNRIFQLANPDSQSVKLIDNNLPGPFYVASLGGFVVAPDTVPEPTGAQLVAFLALAALGKLRAVGCPGDRLDHER
jgi:hypothetical protein